MSVSTNIELANMVFFLHAYQPPTPVQKPKIVRRVIDNSYRPLSEALLSDSEIRLSINVNASLSEVLAVEAPDVIESLCLLAESSQLEFLGSAAYHPILPLLSPEHQLEQVHLNESINREIFGPSYKTQGFFPPELAMNQELVELLTQEQWRYAIAPENLFLSECSVAKVYSTDFFLVKRNRTISNELAFNQLGSDLDLRKAVLNYSLGEFDQVPVVGMDWETFGEHHKGYIDFLIRSLRHIHTIQAGGYVDMGEFEGFTKELRLEELQTSSWSTEEEDLAKNIPFPLWDHPENKLHELINKLLRLTEEMGFQLKRRSTNFYKSHQSCQLWWSSNEHFGPDIVFRAFEFQEQVLTELAGRADEEGLTEDPKFVEKLNLAKELLQQGQEALADRAKQEKRNISRR